MRCVVALVQGLCPSRLPRRAGRDHEAIKRHVRGHDAGEAEEEWAYRQACVWVDDALNDILRALHHRRRMPAAGRGQKREPARPVAAWWSTRPQSEGVLQLEGQLRGFGSGASAAAGKHGAIPASDPDSKRGHAWQAHPASKHAAGRRQLRPHRRFKPGAARRSGAGRWAASCLRERASRPRIEHQTTALERSRTSTIEAAAGEPESHSARPLSTWRAQSTSD